jgi:hypothetical protein
MNKLIMYTLITVGGIVGAYIPSLFGADGFSVWAIVGSTIGGLIGIYAAYKISQNM